MVVKVTFNSINPPPESRRNAKTKQTFLISSTGKHKTTEVVPFGATGPSRGSVNDVSLALPPKPRQTEETLTMKAPSFHKTFGCLGIPMLLMVIGCIIWTMWLIVLSVTPNAAANFLMDTSEFDDGQFWLIPDEWNTLQFFSVVGLVLVLVFYFYDLLKMLVWRSQKNAIQTKMDRMLTSWENAAKAKVRGSLRRRTSARIITASWVIYTQWNAFTSIHGKNRKLWNLCLKIHDLVMLALLLRDLLEAGSPVQIAYGFAALAALNSFSSVVGIFYRRFTALAEILVDTLFDFGATVLYPLTVLNYCSNNFHYDRAVFLINMEILPIGSFERRARMYANPAEIALVRTSFDSLRILDYTDLFLRIGMNLAFSYRCKRIIEVFIDVRARRRENNTTNAQKVSLEQPIYFSFSRSPDMVQRAVPKSLALLLIAYSIGVLFVTHQSISTSQTVCSSCPECVVFAYRWRATEFCPCRALVDGDPAPKTYYEWTHPVDATLMVKALAAAGTLETLQLVNRQLTGLPDELRGCQNLNLIFLINCATEELPAWTKDFHKLQYLQIEGKVGSNNLGDLDQDLLSNMPELRYLQLGVHHRMRRLPALDGAPNLRSMIFSRLYNLGEFPSLENHAALERFELTACRALPWLPDLQAVVPLVRFAVFQGGTLCCNGFLGTCDLTNNYCKTTTCLEDASRKATPATLEVFKEFSDAVCHPHTALSQVPTTETIQMCEGVPFRECNFPVVNSNTSVVGMCYNHRMQVLACNPDPDKMKVRRRQIQDGAGIPCDPEEEAWLGCRNDTMTAP